MSDDRKRDDEQGTPGFDWPTQPVPLSEARPTGQTPGSGETAPEATTRAAGPIRPRPLPPTWMDLSPEDVERLTRQVERAFSSEPFTPLVQTRGGGRGGAARAEEAPRPEGTRPPDEVAATGALAAGEADDEADDDAAAAAGTAGEARDAGRRRRRGSRGRGRRRREGELPAPVNDLESTGDPEISFAEASAAAAIPVEQAAEGAAVVQAAAAVDDAAEEAAEGAEAGEGRRGRRGRRRRGRDREGARPGEGSGREAPRPDERPAREGARAAEAGGRPERRAGGEGREAAAPVEEEPELRVLEEALRAGQPRSAADIGAFDEREQALLKDAWPDAPVREGQGPMRRRSQHGLSMEETFEARREKMAEERRARKGTLYVVATPIGNLEDITFRAVRLLKDVKVIAAEDTRQTAKLLNHYQIRTPLTSFFEHNEQLKIEPLLRRLDDGQAIALVSDAGTPGISDPGYTLVKAAVDRGANVVSVPGACAAVAALSASGLPTDAWAFVGFLPQKDKKRKEILESLKLDRRTLIFYEAPGRTYETIQELCDVLGNRDLVLFREITKMHEEAIRGKFSKILAEYRGDEIKGEVVLVVSGWQGKLADREGLSILDRLRLYKQESGLPLADVVRLVARETGTPKSEVYRESLKLVGVDLDRIRPPKPEPEVKIEPEPVATEAPETGPVVPRDAEPVQVADWRSLPVPEDEPARVSQDTPAQPVATSSLPAGAEVDAEPGSANGVRAPVVLADTIAAAEPDLAGEPDTRQRMSEEAQPDAPDTRPSEAPPAASEASGVAGVEIVEGRPGGGPHIPLAPTTQE